MYSMHRYAYNGTSRKEGSPVRQPGIWLLTRKYKNIIIAAVVSVLLLAMVHHRSSWSTSGISYGYDVHGSKDMSFLSNIPANVHWSDYAYTQYVTNEIYLCNSVMIFESLARLRSKADRVMLYPREWSSEIDTENSTTIGRLLLKARDTYGAKLVPIEVQSFSDQEPTWQASFTKLLAFNQTQYKRVINVDSDATILKSLDSLFFLPPTPLALPRAYWLSEKPNFLTSILLVITPSTTEFSRLEKSIKNHGPNDFDMEIINNVYGKSALILPHKEFGFLTRVLMGEGEGRRGYLGLDEVKGGDGGEGKWQDETGLEERAVGNDGEHDVELKNWDVEQIMEEVRYVHFSDWPIGKPWLGEAKEEVERIWPGCGGRDRLGEAGKRGMEKRCNDMKVWMSLRQDFRARREAVCGGLV